MPAVRKALRCTPCRSQGYAEWQVDQASVSRAFNALCGPFVPAPIQPQLQDVFLCAICRREATQAGEERVA